METKWLRSSAFVESCGGDSVRIEPQFEADWESVNSDKELIMLYAEKAKEAGYENNIRKLMDGDTSLYGADCGFSNSNASPKDPRTDDTATFERGIVHHVRHGKMKESQA
ncbi:hypothetical protein BBJ29_002041 [Phytophthora kernoviae]|uniref:Uncharacterized protein n=1 Tax=Phytophthora kernoviae TaxID=325452 RepID=A0A3F2RR49_9STRA|nr:hypothetical protein BBJ29_002041 [Phytophthora kernoviae]RLN62591.1 hypothetical protein BBP00_00004653 [Phytophthora kernoviae]